VTTNDSVLFQRSSSRNFGADPIQRKNSLINSETAPGNLSPRSNHAITSALNAVSASSESSPSNLKSNEALTDSTTAVPITAPTADRRDIWRKKKNHSVSSDMNSPKSSREPDPDDKMKQPS